MMLQLLLLMLLLLSSLSLITNYVSQCSCPLSTGRPEKQEGHQTSVKRFVIYLFYVFSQVLTNLIIIESSINELVLINNN